MLLNINVVEYKCCSFVGHYSNMLENIISNFFHYFVHAILNYKLKEYLVIFKKTK